MVRPTEKEKDLQRLDQIENSQLRPQFVIQADNIRKKIYTSAKAKKVNGKQLNGHLLVALCKGYMEAINKGALPNVESAWYYVCRSEGIKAIKQASNFLESKI